MAEEEKCIKVMVARDGMTAEMIVSPTPEKQITMSDLKGALAEAGVEYGIMQESLQSILDCRTYSIPVLVAHGTEPQNGKDGHFEFLFETNVEVKPKILADGSVDYKSMGQIPVVEEGQELARYYPATDQISGRNVLGKEILGKKGKDLQVLKGKGFVLNEEKTIYKAAIVGKATAKDNTLNVTNVLVIDGDVTTSTGGVTFAGDVVIKGNVATGAEVRANGNIEVDGCVEAAFLVAGKGVVLKNGMQGNGKGSINAGGSVSGKFFEQVTIRAGGTVAANAMMNCHVESEEEVKVSGKFGVIVGGYIQAYRGIEATIIGNMSETKTLLEAGTSEDLRGQMMNAEEKILELTKDLEKLKSANQKVVEMLKQYPDNNELKQTKMTIMRSKIARESSMSEVEREKERIAIIMGKVSNPRVCVLKSIYPGCVITINGVTEKLKTENYNVFYQKNGVELEFRPNL